MSNEAAMTTTSDAPVRTVAETFAALLDAPPNNQMREVLHALAMLNSTIVDAVAYQSHRSCPHDQEHVRNWQSHMWWLVSDELDTLAALVEKLK